MREKHYKKNVNKTPLDSYNGTTVHLKIFEFSVNLFEKKKNLIRSI